MRVPDEPDRFIVKGRGYAVDVLPVVRGEDMIVCDLDGAMVEGPPGGMPCFEVEDPFCDLQESSQTCTRSSTCILATRC